MSFTVPLDFCQLDTDIRTCILSSAESAMRDQKKVFFGDKHFTNFDELKAFLTERCKQSEANHDWPGEVIDDIG